MATVGSTEYHHRDLNAAELGVFLLRPDTAQALCCACDYPQRCAVHALAAELGSAPAGGWGETAASVAATPTRSANRPTWPGSQAPCCHVAPHPLTRLGVTRYNVVANQSAVRWITLSAIVWSSLNTP